MFAWLIPAALVVGAPALKDRRPADAEVKARLVGTWDLQAESGAGLVLVFEFRADGTVEAAMTRTAGSRATVLTTQRGAWSVRDGHLVLTGVFAGRYEVLSADRGALRCRTAGKVWEWARRP